MNWRIWRDIALGCISVPLVIILCPFMAAGQAWRNHKGMKRRGEATVALLLILAIAGGLGFAVWSSQQDDKPPALKVAPASYAAQVNALAAQCEVELNAKGYGKPRHFLRVVKVKDGEQLLKSGWAYWSTYGGAWVHGETHDRASWVVCDPDTGAMHTRAFKHEYFHGRLQDNGFHGNDAQHAEMKKQGWY